MKTLKTFSVSLLLTVLGLITIYVFTKSLAALYAVIILSILEISLSFDNAVVNAKILNKMSPKWQKRFLIWGIAIAVFGVRLVLPVFMVYCTTHLSFTEVVYTAMYQPSEYHQALLVGYPLISAFGSVFLWLVFLHFLMDGQRELAWWPWLERHAMVRMMQRYPVIGILITVATSIVVSLLEHSWVMLIAFFAGIALYLALEQLNKLFSGLGGVGRSGLISFLYLEVLDASFSFDGVVGAFAISKDIFVIMVGLGIGAFYIRSFTIWMVEQQTLKSLPFLEHGAHYAIGALAFAMLLHLYLPIPEWLTGGVSAVLLIIAAYASVKYQRRQQVEAL